MFRGRKCKRQKLSVFLYYRCQIKKYSTHMQKQLRITTQRCSMNSYNFGNFPGQFYLKSCRRYFGQFEFERLPIVCGRYFLALNIRANCISYDKVWRMAKLYILYNCDTLAGRNARVSILYIDCYVFCPRIEYSTFTPPPCFSSI